MRTAEEVAARAAPAATPAQGVVPGAATVPGAAPGPRAAPRKRRRQEGAGPLTDPPPGQSLAPSPAPGLAPVHPLPLKTNSPAPALDLDPALVPAHVPALRLQTANIEIDTPVGRLIDCMVACDGFFFFFFKLKGRKSPFYMASFETRSSVIGFDLFFVSLDVLPQENYLCSYYFMISLF